MITLDRFYTFTVLIDRLKRNIRKIKSEEMAEFELKSPHVSCIYHLYRNNALTSKELVEICEEDKAAISRSLEFLEEGGYILCDEKPRKRYKSPFRLTEKGERVAKKVIEKVDRILDKASEGLTDTEREIMYRGLTMIAENLDRICGAYEE